MFVYVYNVWHVMTQRWISSTPFGCTLKVYLHQLKHVHLNGRKQREHPYSFLKNSQLTFTFLTFSTRFSPDPLPCSVSNLLGEKRRNAKRSRTTNHSFPLDAVEGPIPHGDFVARVPSRGRFRTLILSPSSPRHTRRILNCRWFVQATKFAIPYVRPRTTWSFGNLTSIFTLGKKPRKP